MKNNKLGAHKKNIKCGMCNTHFDVMNHTSSQADGCSTEIYHNVAIIFYGSGQVITKHALRSYYGSTYDGHIYSSEIEDLNDIKFICDDCLKLLIDDNKVKLLYDHDIWMEIPILPNN